jgi:cytochrome P450
MVGPLPHRALKDLASKYGPLMHLQLGQTSAVVVSSPETAKQVMKTHDLLLATRPSILAVEILSYERKNIAFAPYGDYWRQMRKIATLELLSSKKVRSFCSIREEELKNLVESINSSSSESLPIDLTEAIFSLISSVVTRSAFGDKCTVDRDSFIKLMNEAISLSGGFDVSDLFPSFKLLPLLTGIRSKLVKIHRKLDEMFDKIIDEHVLAKGDIDAQGTEDLVDVLLRIKDSDALEFPITHINIKGVIIDMFMAGTETSSVTIDWAMSEMIRNPRVMEKAQAELRQALKGKQVITESDIKEFSYLKSVIKETLRMHPPLALLLPRECMEECQIDGYTIPVKTKVIVNAWAIGRHPEYWKDPDCFYPERFENGAGLDFMGSNYEFLPFGAGRRMCPGITFALAGVELFLASLLYHFDWSLPNNMKSENLDMTENFGATVARRNHLLLIAKRQNLSV